MAKERKGEAAPPAVKADVVAQPLQPLADVVADKVLRVVDVGRRVEGVAGADVAAAVKVRVVRHDRVRVPVHPAAKLVPDAVGVLPACRRGAQGRRDGQPAMRR